MGIYFAVQCRSVRLKGFWKTTWRNEDGKIMAMLSGLTKMKNTNDAVVVICRVVGFFYGD